MHGGGKVHTGQHGPSGQLSRGTTGGPVCLLPAAGLQSSQTLEDDVAELGVGDGVQHGVDDCGDLGQEARQHRGQRGDQRGVPEDPDEGDDGERQPGHAEGQRDEDHQARHLHLHLPPSGLPRAAGARPGLPRRQGGHVLLYGSGREAERGRGAPGRGEVVVLQHDVRAVVSEDLVVQVQRPHDAQVAEEDDHHLQHADTQKEASVTGNQPGIGSQSGINTRELIIHRVSQASIPGN